MALYDKLKHGIRFWLLRRLPTCQQTVVTISQSMERPLTIRERVLVKPDLITGPNLSDEARERIKRKLASSN